MSVILSIILFIVFIILDVVFAFWFREIAELKGYDSKSYHIWARCFWFGFVGYLYVIGLPDRTELRIEKTEDSDVFSNNTNQDF